MKYIYTLLSLFACFALFNSCDKETKCEDNGSPVVSTNGPVPTGGTLNLSVTGVDNVALYKWSGPNNFSSNEQNPVIENVTSYSSGVYTVDVITNDGCIMRAYTDSLIVDGELPTCYLGKNRGTFNFAIDYMSFYSVSHEWEEHTIVFDAYTNYGSLIIEIRGKDYQLRPGLYDIVEDYKDFDAGSARVTLKYVTSVFTGSGGKLTVKIVNGKPTMECCEIPFKSERYTNELTGSLSLTED